MGTARIEGPTLWVRCWDGDEMEYECFDIKTEVIPLLGFTDQEFAFHIGAQNDNQFTLAMNNIRKNHAESIIRSN